MSIEYKIGPNTAGLAIRIKSEKGINYKKNKNELYILARNYLNECAMNQFGFI